jgi:ankyrin repeat protein
LFANEVNIKNAKGNTPFHQACLKGNIGIVQMLYRMECFKEISSGSRP